VLQKSPNPAVCSSACSPKVFPKSDNFGPEAELSHPSGLKEDVFLIDSADDNNDGLTEFSPMLHCETACDLESRESAQPESILFIGMIEN
jgi:hypothetical protein